MDNGVAYFQRLVACLNDRFARVHRANTAKTTSPKPGAQQEIKECREQLTLAYIHYIRFLIRHSRTKEWQKLFTEVYKAQTGPVRTVTPYFVLEAGMHIHKLCCYLKVLTYF